MGLPLLRCLLTLAVITLLTASLTAAEGPYVSALFPGANANQYYFSISNVTNTNSDFSITVGGLNCTVDYVNYEPNSVLSGACSVRNPYALSITNLLSPYLLGRSGKGWLVEQWLNTTGAADRYAKNVSADNWWVTNNPNINLGSSSYFTNSTYGYRISANVSVPKGVLTSTQYFASDQYKLNLVCNGKCSLSIRNITNILVVSQTGTTTTSPNILQSIIQSIVTSISSLMSSLFSSQSTQPMETSGLVQSHVVTDFVNPSMLDNFSAPNLPDQGALTCQSLQASSVATWNGDTLNADTVYEVVILHQPNTTLQISLTVTPASISVNANTYFCSLPSNGTSYNYTIPDYLAQNLTSRVVGGLPPANASVLGIQNATEAATAARNFFLNPSVGIDRPIGSLSGNATLLVGPGEARYWQAYFVPQATSYYVFVLNATNAVSNFSLQVNAAYRYHVDYSPRGTALSLLANRDTGDTAAFRFFKLYAGKSYLMQVTYYNTQAAANGSVALLFQRYDTLPTSYYTPTHVPLPLNLLRNVVKGTGVQTLPFFSFPTDKSFAALDSKFNVNLRTSNASVSDVIISGDKCYLNTSLTEGLTYKVVYVLTPSVLVSSSNVTASASQASQGYANLTLNAKVLGVPSFLAVPQVCVTKNTCFNLTNGVTAQNPFALSVANASCDVSSTNSTHYFIKLAGKGFFGANMSLVASYGVALSSNGSQTGVVPCAVTDIADSTLTCAVLKESMLNSSLVSANFTLFYTDVTGASRTLSWNLTVGFLPVTTTSTTTLATSVATSATTTARTSSTTTTVFATATPSLSAFNVNCVPKGLNNVSDGSLVFALQNSSSVASVRLQCSSTVSFSLLNYQFVLDGSQLSSIRVVPSSYVTFIDVDVPIGNAAENSSLEIGYSISSVSSLQATANVSGSFTVRLVPQRRGQVLSCSMIYASSYSRNLLCSGGFYNNTFSIWSLNLFLMDTVIPIPVSSSQFSSSLKSNSYITLSLPPFDPDYANLVVEVHNSFYPESDSLTAVVSYVSNYVAVESVNSYVLGTFDGPTIDPIAQIILTKEFLRSAMNSSSLVMVFSLEEASFPSLWASLYRRTLNLSESLCTNGVGSNYTNSSFVNLLYDLTFQSASPLVYTAPDLGPQLYRAVKCIGLPPSNFRAAENFNSFAPAQPGFNPVQLLDLLNAAVAKVTLPVLTLQFSDLGLVLKNLLSLTVYLNSISGTDVIFSHALYFERSTVSVYVQQVNSTASLQQFVLWDNSTGNLAPNGVISSVGIAGVQRTERAFSNPLYFAAIRIVNYALAATPSGVSVFKDFYLRTAVFNSVGAEADDVALQCNYILTLPNNTYDIGSVKQTINSNSEMSLTQYSANTSAYCALLNENFNDWSPRNCTSAYDTARNVMLCNCTSTGVMGFGYNRQNLEVSQPKYDVVCPQLTRQPGLVKAENVRVFCSLVSSSDSFKFNLSAAGIQSYTLVGLSNSSSITPAPYFGDVASGNFSFYGTVLLYPGPNNLLLNLTLGSGSAFPIFFTLSAYYPNASVLNAFIDDIESDIVLNNANYELLGRMDNWLLNVTSTQKASILDRIGNIYRRLVISSVNVQLPNLTAITQGINNSSALVSSIGIPTMNSSEANAFKSLLTSAILTTVTSANLATSNAISGYQATSGNGSYANSSVVTSSIVNSLAAERQLQRMVVPLLVYVYNTATNIGKSDVMNSASLIASVSNTQQLLQNQLSVKPLDLQSLSTMSGSVAVNFNDKRTVSSSNNSYINSLNAVDNSSAILSNVTNEATMWTQLLSVLESTTIRALASNDSSTTLNFSQADICLNSMRLFSSNGSSENATLELGCNLQSNETHFAKASEVIGLMDNTDLAELVTNSTGNSSAIGYLLTLGSNPFYYSEVSANIAPNVTQFSLLTTNGSEIELKDLKKCINISLYVNASMYGSTTKSLNYSTTNSTVLVNRTLTVAPACRYWNSSLRAWSSSGLNSSYYNSTTGAVYCCWSHLSIFGIESVGSIDDLAPSINLNVDASRLQTLKDHPWVIAVYTVIFGVYVVGMIVLLIQKQRDKNKNFPLVSPRRYLVYVKSNDFKLFNEAQPCITLVGRYGNSPPTLLYAWHQLGRVQKGNVRMFHVLSPVVGHIHEVIVENVNKKTGASWQLDGIRVIDTAHGKCYTFSTPAREPVIVMKPVRMQIPTLTKRREPLWPRVYFTCIYSLREGHRFWSVILKPTVSPLSRMARLTMLLYMIMANFFLSALIYSNPANNGTLVTRIGFAFASWFATTVTAYILSFIWQRSTRYFSVQKRSKKDGSPTNQATQEMDAVASVKEAKILRKNKPPVSLDCKPYTDDDDDEGATDNKSRSSERFKSPIVRNDKELEDSIEGKNYVDSLANSSHRPNASVGFSGTGKGLAGSLRSSRLNRSFSRPNSPTRANDGQVPEPANLDRSVEASPLSSPKEDADYQPFNNSTHASFISDTSASDFAADDSRAASPNSEPVHASKNDKSASLNSGGATFTSSTGGIGQGLKRKIGGGHRLELDEEEKKVNPFVLPYYCKYIAWLLAFGGIIAFMIFSWIQVLAPTYPSIDGWLVSSVIAILLDLVAWVPVQMLFSAIMIVIVSCLFE